LGPNSPNSFISLNLLFPPPPYLPLHIPAIWFPVLTRPKAAPHSSPLTRVVLFGAAPPPPAPTVAPGAFSPYTALFVPPLCIATRRTFFGGGARLFLFLWGGCGVRKSWSLGFFFFFWESNSFPPNHLSLLICHSVPQFYPPFVLPSGPMFSPRRFPCSLWFAVIVGKFGCWV
jgi:hypothetical protein